MNKWNSPLNMLNETSRNLWLSYRYEFIPVPSLILYLSIRFHKDTVSKLDFQQSLFGQSTGQALFLRRRGFQCRNGEKTRKHLCGGERDKLSLLRRGTPANPPEVQWSVRAEPLSKVSAGARYESVVWASRTSARYLCLHSFCSADSPPKTPLDPLRRKEGQAYHASERKNENQLGETSKRAEGTSRAMFSDRAELNWYKETAYSLVQNLMSVRLIPVNAVWNHKSYRYHVNTP